MLASNILAIDVGEKRVGLAFARKEVRVPVLLQTLNAESEDLWENLKSIISEYDIENIVIGLPRGLEGQNTPQTDYVRAFAEKLSTHTALPIHWQDEALTSIQAKEILGKSGKTYQKSDVDALAASLILSDYLENQGSKE